MTGSCFSTEVGTLMKENGYDVVLNPFGILFNPASIASSLERLESGAEFTRDDVVRRVDDASRGVFSYVSFHHHGSAGRATPEEFLRDANATLRQASAEFREADTVVLTLGTAWVFRHREKGFVVANCHKVPAREFDRVFLSEEDIVSLLSPVVGRHPDKRWIFTVSPVRHLADGAHANQLSKSTLLLAVDKLQRLYPDSTGYFPAYEIMLDDLRDRSWYAADGVHPGPEAVRIIYNSFIEKYKPSKI